MARAWLRCRGSAVGTQRTGYCNPSSFALARSLRRVADDDGLATHQMKKGRREGLVEATEDARLPSLLRTSYLKGARVFGHAQQDQSSHKITVGGKVLQKGSQTAKPDEACPRIHTKQQNYVCSLIEHLST